MSGGIFSVALSIGSRLPYLKTKFSHKAPFLLGVRTFLPLLRKLKRERLPRMPKKIKDPIKRLIEILLRVELKTKL